MENLDLTEACQKKQKNKKQSAANVNRNSEQLPYNLGMQNASNGFHHVWQRKV